MRKTLSTALLVLGLVVIATGAQAARQDNDGFLYGTVVTDSGKEYTGFLRWNADEEAFWDDLFHSAKTKLPYIDEVDRADRRRDRKKHTNIKIFGFRVNVESDDWAGDDSRVFIARFGDIERITVKGDDAARLDMKGGESLDVEGYANDVGATILVKDAGLGEIELHWDNIDTIRFAAAPRGADPGEQRLYGKLETRIGSFEGFIQWDKEECLASDRLDGETEDGELSIPMGSIARIERHGSQGCEVTLKDGRDYRLRGSNDVNDDNRGIMVEDKRYGRVVIYWDEFDRLDFEDRKDSGRGYGDYEGQKPLSGTVVGKDGEKHRGRIVFDLDESENWEMLNGNWRDAEYNIPFSLVARIEPGRDESRVLLRGGEELWLEDSQDVTENNDGLLIFDQGDADPLYLRWQQIESIEFGD